MKKILLITFFLCVLSAAAFAQGLGEANHLFYRANSAYREGNFDSAISDYKNILALGLESGNVYYNLANSYFKKDDLGRAVFYYEKALALIPAESDLRSNYEFALSSLGIGHEYFGNRFQISCVKLFDGVTVDSLAVVLSVLNVLVVFILILNLYFSRAKILLKTVLPVLVLVIILASTALGVKITFLNKGAIVVTGPLDAKFEPQETATTFFKLNSGNRVEILDEVTGWAKIRRPDGKIGWVNKSDIQAIK